MIDCGQYRRAILSEPETADPEISAHRARCAECTAYTERMGRFEMRLARAMRLGLPAAAARSPDRRRWFALAASLLVAAGVAGVLWLAVPRSSLADAVVAHMADEPQAWFSNGPVPSARLSEAIGDAHIRLRPAAGMVSYASSCEFRGFHVPHLVVQDATGPVTVMVLVHESARSTANFDEHGYRGSIVPVPGHGAIAVLTRNRGLSGAEVDRIAAQLLGAIDWGA